MTKCMSFWMSKCIINMLKASNVKSQVKQVSIVSCDSYAIFLLLRTTLFENMYLPHANGSKFLYLSLQILHNHFVNI